MTSLPAATRRGMRLLQEVAAAIVWAAAVAAQPPIADTAHPAPATRTLRLDLYVRADSKACNQAVVVAKAFVHSRKGVELIVHDVVGDRAALERYWKLMRAYRVEKPTLPAFYACHSLKLGFAVSEGESRLAELFTIHAYIRQSCQHCRDAMRFLRGLAERWVGVRVVYHEVEQDRQALQEMLGAARRFGVAAPSLPGIIVCGRFFSGYRSDATTGRQIEELLWQSSTQPPESAEKASVFGKSALATLPKIVQAGYGIDGKNDTDGTSTTADELGALPIPEAISSTAEAPGLPPVESPSGDGIIYGPAQQAEEEVDLPWLGRISLRDFGLPLFTLAIGLIDGFNPCAMWVLVFLLSVLANVKDRRKIAAIAGTFVVVSGAAYYAFMAAWLNLFMLIDLVRPLQIAIGLLAVGIGVINVKDFFAFKRGITLSIPESAKPGIYERVRKIVASNYLSVAIGLSVVLAVTVNIVELLCTMGLPALYTQILSQQQLAAWKNYAYLALYIAGYMFDDGLMVGAFVITLSHRKLREDEGRWLKLVSGVVVLVLGATVLFRPEWLQWNRA